MKEYSIGLDIGVASIGWVCISPDYQVLKYNNRYAIGVHEFESAKVAAERRLQRSTRRRYNRRKKRIQLLQSLFKEEMELQYPKYFSINEKQHFWQNTNEFEHRTLSELLRELKLSTNTFPTMYHLRQELLTTTERIDLRLIYLALHHLVKYRGHFLNENLKWGTSEETIDLSTMVQVVIHGFEELNNLQTNPKTMEELQQIQSLLLNTKMTRNDRAKALKVLIGKEYEQLFKLLLGLKVAADKFFSHSENMAKYKEQKLTFQISSEEFESQIAELQEEEHRYLESLQPVYQQLILHNLLDGAKTVAEAKVRDYGIYEQQLKNVKYIVDKFAMEKVYREIFITTKRNQTAYAKKPDLKLLCLFDQYRKSKKSEEAFLKKVKGILEVAVRTADLPEDLKIAEDLFVLLDNEQLLVKQRSAKNAAIPYQNNVYEARQIIQHQQKYYSFMTEQWLEKVIQIISFRIPYYIGPLGKSEFAWMQRKQNISITPWTFDEVVDKSNSAEQFIQRMTNYCTYLKDEPVLPKQSLLYERFEVLNELNSIQLRGENEQPNKKYRLDNELKKWIIDNVFRKYKKVTHEKLLSELKKYPHYDELDLEGKLVFGTQKEKEFAASLSTHITFAKYLKALGEGQVERIIYYLTVFTEKDIIVEKISSECPQLTLKEVEQLAQIKVTGWGRISKKLLDDLLVNNSVTAIEYMEKHEVNFMELMSQTDLKGKIQVLRPPVTTKKIQYADIQTLSGSPALKRGIWRAMKIVEELTTIFGEPKQIMIEVARDEQPSKRTKSSKQQWEELGKEWKEAQDKQFYKEILTYDDKDFKDLRFRLYMHQQGRCLYTGEVIHLTELANESLYEIDHILPRSFVVDNSLDNLVLVTRNANQRKGSNKTPLESIPSNQQWLRKQEWARLHSLRLMSKRKLDHLMKLSFTDQDKEGFMNRQLVETRQIIVNVKDLLEGRFAETEIHLVKAGIVSKFRKSLKLPKVREYNNKHHAIDALLTVVLIQFIEQQYGRNFLAFDFKHKEQAKKWNKIILNKIDKKEQDFFVFKAFREATFINHQHEEKNGINYINELFYKLPWQTTKMLGSSEARFYKETIYSPKVKAAKYESDKATKFVHDEVKNAKSVCIRYEIDKKGKVQELYKIVDLKVIETYQLKHLTSDELAMYLIQRVEKNLVISAQLYYELEKYQRINIAGHPYYFVSSSELHNAKQWQLPQNLLESVSNPHCEELEKEQLQQLFKEVATNFLTQYVVYDTTTFVSKINSYIEKEIQDYRSFDVGLKELYKAAAASATRSDVFGSRIAKSVKPQELELIYESITGLHYRKPRLLVSMKKTTAKEKD